MTAVVKNQNFVWNKHFKLFYGCQCSGKYQQATQRKKCPYSELFESAFFGHYPAFRLNMEFL